MAAELVLQNNHRIRAIHEDCIHVNNFLPSSIPSEPPEPLDVSISEGKSFLGFLHLISGMSFLMTIPIQVKRTLGQWATQIKHIYVDNSGVKPVTPEWDRGVTCACPLSRRCSIYDICCRRCLRTVDRSGRGLPILQESDTERWFASNDKTVERHVEEKRVKWSTSTRLLQWKYRYMLKKITFHLSSLVQDGKLSYWSLKRCVYTLRPRLNNKSMGRNLGVEEMLNEFYPPFYDVNHLKKLIAHVESDLRQPIPVKAWLTRFEKAVDHFLSSRVILPGVNGDGHQNAMFYVDPEWRSYPACDLYKIHKRVCEALHRVRKQLFAVVYFCTVLKGYFLLNCVENFAQTMRERVERQPTGVEDSHAMSSLSKEATSSPFTNESEPKDDGLPPTIKEAEGIGLPPTIKEVECTSSVVDSRGNEYEHLDSLVEFPSPVNGKASGHSALITGFRLGHPMIIDPTTIGGWPSLDYSIPRDIERVSLDSDSINIIKPFLYHYSFE